MLSNICFKHWINIIYACIAQIEKIYVDFNNINNQTIFSKPGKPRWKYNVYFYYTYLHIIYGIFTLKLMYKCKSIIKIHDIDFVKKLEHFTHIWKQKSPDVSRVFCISNNISTPRMLFCNNLENKYFLSILTREQNRANFYLYRRTK